MKELSARFKISRKTGYKWLRRYRQEAEAGLVDRSRRPKTSPQRTVGEIEERVLELRKEHPAWGPRKLKRRLEDMGNGEGLPGCSTLGRILKRHGCIEPQQSQEHRRYQRFEREAANELWQMDFKGDFALSRGGRCYPLPILDDHSRYAVGIYACPNQRTVTVRWHLSEVFERCGLPEEILCDHGSPWAGPGGEWTTLGVWLLRQGVKVLHGRPYHPQTQGKEERLNRTLKAEVLHRRDLRDLAEAQAAFDQWRQVYNFERPHEALGLEVPAKRYRASKRSYKACLEPILYGQEDVVLKVQAKGTMSWKGRLYFVGEAFAGEHVAMRRTVQESCYEVYYSHQRLGRIDLRTHEQKRWTTISIRDKSR